MNELNDKLLMIQELMRHGYFEHNIYTPEQLIDELIQKVEIDNKKILVLYNLEIVLILVQKYNVPVNNITLLATSIPKINICNKLKINVITELREDMKFNVVLGNPPYDEQNTAKNIKLWRKFSEKALLLSTEYIAFVTPDGALSDTINGVKLREEIKNNSFGFISAVLHDKNGNNYFKNVGVTTCHWVLKKNSKDLINPLQVITRKELSPIENSIISKVISYPTKLDKHFENYVKNEEIDADGKNEFYKSADKKCRTNKDLFSIGLKVVMPFSASYHKMFISDVPTGMLNACVLIKSKEEGQKIIDYCQTKLFKFVANNYKKTSGFTPFVKDGMIPDLRNADTSNIYSIFNLTDDEINYIENNYK